MKFIKKVFFVFSLISILLIGTSFADTGKVNVSATRLRKENNTDSDIITNIYEGDSVEIVGEAGEWYQVKYNGNTGYVKKEYLTVSKNNTNNSPSKNETNTVKNETSNSSVKNEANVSNSQTANTTVENNVSASDSTVTTNSVANLKNLPSMISSNIAQVEASKQLTMLEEIGNWVQVTDGTITGWISRSKIVTSTPETVNSSDFSNTSTQNQVVNNSAENKSNASNTTNTAAQNITQENKVSKETAVNKTGIINVETAKVREGASSTAKVTEFLDYNDKVTIVAEDGEWYKVTSSKASGYVNKRLITVQEDSQVSSRNLSEPREESEHDNTVVSNEANNNLSSTFNNSNIGNQVADYAKQYLGYSYVVGGKTPTSGFDCSGFTKYVFSNFGYSLGSTAASQTNIGTEVSRENLQVGDLILFYNEGKTSIGHTGIYIGNGDFIHAANPSRGVVTDNLNTNSYYNERFVSARRIAE